MTLADNSVPDRVGIINSLDPRVNRLALPDAPHVHNPDDKAQLATYEVFQQMKAGKPFEHAGIVHASDPDLAWMFGKEQFSRRGGTCESMFVVATADLTVTDYTEGGANILDIIKTQTAEVSQRQDTDQPATTYEVFYLKKRGKQHYHAGQVTATSPAEALRIAATQLHATPCLNAWVAPTTAVLFSDAEDKDIWLTLPDKKYRDAIAYRSQDKIDSYKQRQAAI